MMNRILNQLEHRIFLLELAIVNEKSRPDGDKAKIIKMEKRLELLINEMSKKQDELLKEVG